MDDAGVQEAKTPPRAAGSSSGPAHSQSKCLLSESAPSGSSEVVRRYRFDTMRDSSGGSRGREIVRITDTTDLAGVRYGSVNADPRSTIEAELVWETAQISSRVSAAFRYVRTISTFRPPAAMIGSLETGSSAPQSTGGLPRTTFAAWHTIASQGKRHRRWSSISTVSVPKWIVRLKPSVRRTRCFRGRSSLRHDSARRLISLPNRVTQVGTTRGPRDLIRLPGRTLASRPAATTFPGDTEHRPNRLNRPDVMIRWGNTTLTPASSRQRPFRHVT